MSARARPRHHSILRNFWVRLASYVLVIIITLVHVWPVPRGTAFVAGLSAIVLLWSLASLALAMRAQDARKAEMHTLIVDTGFADWWRFVGQWAGLICWVLLATTLTTIYRRLKSEAPPPPTYRSPWR